MLRTSTALCALMGSALLAGGIAFADTGIRSLTQSQAFIRSVLFGEPVAPKGDRLDAPRPADAPSNVSIVEIVGLTHATVILRGDGGEVLYRSDPRSRITTITKNTELPLLTVRDEGQGPMVPHPRASSREGKEETRKPKRPARVGCMGDVSPLVSASANRMPSLCLASLEAPLL